MDPGSLGAIARETGAANADAMCEFTGGRPTDVAAARDYGEAVWLAGAVA
jgi:hypothetical protein